MHHKLLGSYYDSSAGPNSVEDDGYFLLNVGHHLIGAGRMSELRQLLCSASWLQNKMNQYGAASVVTDFRRSAAHTSSINQQIALPLLSLFCFENALPVIAVSFVGL